MLRTLFHRHHLMPCISWGRRGNSWPLSAFSMSPVILQTFIIPFLYTLQQTTADHHLICSLLLWKILQIFFQGSCLFWGFFSPCTDSKQWEPAAQAPSTICSLGLYSGTWRAISEPQNPSKVPQCHGMIGERRKQKPSAVTDFAPCITTVHKSDGLVINVFYFSAATYSCLSGKNLSGSCCFFAFKPLNSCGVLV